MATDLSINQQHERRPAPTSNIERDQRTVELLVEALEGDPLHREALEAEAIELNLPLARYLASKYQNRGIASEDLRQVAYLGLMKAVRGFTPGRETGFAAYAIPTIRGELRRHFRDTGWTIRPPRRIQELRASVRAAQAELTQTLSRTPTAAEIAAALEVEVEDVLEASSVDSCFTPNSLDAPVAESDDLINEPGKVDLEFERTETRVVLELALRDLADRDRYILDLRYFEGLTQREIGEQIGISQMQVSRILSRVLDTIRSNMQLEEAA